MYSAIEDGKAGVLKEIKIMDLEKSIMGKFNEKKQKLLDVQVRNTGLLILTFDSTFIKSTDFSVGVVSTSDLLLDNIFKYFFSVISVIDIDSNYTLVTMTGLDKYIKESFPTNDIEILKIANGVAYTFIKDSPIL